MNKKKAKEPVEIPFDEADLLASVTGFTAQLQAGKVGKLRINEVQSRTP